MLPILQLAQLTSGAYRYLIIVADGYWVPGPFSCNDSDSLLGLAAPNVKIVG